MNWNIVLKIVSIWSMIELTEHIIFNIIPGILPINFYGIILTLELNVYATIMWIGIVAVLTYYAWIRNLNARQSRH